MVGHWRRSSPHLHTDHTEGGEGGGRGRGREGGGRRGQGGEVEVVVVVVVVVGGGEGREEVQGWMMGDGWREKMGKGEGGGVASGKVEEGERGMAEEEDSHPNQS